MGKTWILSMASISAVAKPSQEVPRGLEGHQSRGCFVGQRDAKRKTSTQRNAAAAR